MTETKFGKLFTLELLHKYFADGVSNDFTITPSKQSQQVLNGNKIIAKQYGSKLFAGVQIDLLTGKPTPVPANGMQLTFFLQLNNVFFFNYTNLPSPWPSGKLYYFTNRNSNVQNGKNFLSQFIVYDNAKTYKPGDLATDGAGMVYQSIRTSNGITPSLANDDFWVQVDANQYMSEADALQWMPTFSTYNFTSLQPSATVDVWGYNAALHDYSTSLISTTIPFGKPAISFTLDLRSLSPGKYKLRINGVDQWIYINDELSISQTFAVVEIFNESSIAAQYKLLDGTNALLSPLYTVNFLNRYTIWKYILASGANGDITDNASVYQFTPPSAGTVYSLVPMPLSEKALDIALSLNLHVYSPLPCATPQRLVHYKPAADTYNCSEIFLNF